MINQKQTRKQKTNKQSNIGHRRKKAEVSSLRVLMTINSFFNKSNKGNKYVTQGTDADTLYYLLFAT